MNKIGKLKISMINKQNRIRLYRYYKIMSNFLMNNVENYERILIPNVTSWNNSLDVNVFEL